MKRHFLLIVLLFAIAFPAFAQIEAEMQQSKTEKIIKGRAYLLEKFLDRDYDKVKEIKDYLLTLEDDNYVALRPVELWHILQWTKEYDELTSLLRRSDSAYMMANAEYGYFDERFGTKVFPGWDNLGTQLQRRSAEDKHLLQYGLQEANLTPEDKTFLYMFLDWLFVDRHYLIRDVQKDENQTRLNEMATQFLSDYPNSDYEWFVRNKIRKEYVEKDWGFGLGFDFRSGFTSGPLPNNGIGMGISLDVLYKKFDLTLGVGTMTLHTTQEQLYNYEGVTMVYPKGEKCNWSLPYLNLAYYVYDGNRIAFSPFVGIGWIYELYPFNKNQDEEDKYKDLEKNYLLCKVGANFDVKMEGISFNKDLIRIRYEFGLTGLGKEQLSMVHLISIGWTGIVRGSKRAY